MKHQHDMTRSTAAVSVLATTAVAVCLLAACTTDAADSAQHATAARTTDILLGTASVPTAAQTRAEGADTYAKALPKGSHIGVYIYDNNGNDISKEQVNDANDKKISALWIYKTVDDADPADNNKSALTLDMEGHTLNPRYPLTGQNPRNHVKILAVYPYKTGHTPSSDPLAYQFPVNLDQRVAANVAASDLLSTGLQTRTYDDCNGKKLDLVMKHQTARLKVVFQPKSGSDLTAANMPDEFKVLNVYHTLNINPKATSGTGITCDETAGKTTTESPLKGNTEQSFLLPPQKLDAGTTLLTFDIKPTEKVNNINGSKFNGIKDAKFNIPTGGVTLQAGYYYVVTVTVDVDFATITGTITGWNENTTLDAYGHPYDDTYNPKDSVIL